MSDSPVTTFLAFRAERVQINTTAHAEGTQEFIQCDDGRVFSVHQSNDFVTVNGLLLLGDKSWLRELIYIPLPRSETSVPISATKLGPIAERLMPDQNRLAAAIDDMDRASLDDLSALTARQRRQLRGLCQHWADLAYQVDSIELADHHDHRHMAGARNS